jgi:hypothetical protein
LNLFMRDIKIYIILIMCICWQAAAAGADRHSEYEVKAAFIYNFAKFIDWPSDNQKDSVNTINIGVLGDDPFDGAIEKTIGGRKIRGKSLVVMKSDDIDHLQSCHILFICQSENERIDTILESLKGLNILTVSEEEYFTYRGGIVRFYKEDNKIRFEFNLAAARKAGLAISSKLLKVARIYDRSGH